MPCPTFRYSRRAGPHPGRVISFERSQDRRCSVAVHSTIHGTNHRLLHGEKSFQHKDKSVCISLYALSALTWLEFDAAKKSAKNSLRADVDGDTSRNAHRWLQVVHHDSKPVVESDVRCYDVEVAWARGVSQTDRTPKGTEPTIQLSVVCRAWKKSRCGVFWAWKGKKGLVYLYTRPWSSEVTSAPQDLDSDAYLSKCTRERKVRVWNTMSSILMKVSCWRHATPSGGARAPPVTLDRYGGFHMKI
ncbi:hypothetical protein B0H10DRAFT_2197628 [Mycena sp. CBHHK59/15]|nr:hypothetical protein B0H10DRAFT_2197628 [Mycena sp. CBHHK59/15]